MKDDTETTPPLSSEDPMPHEAESVDSETTTESPIEPPPVDPVRAKERIELLDMLRGFAVLGILLANIPFMAMAGAAVTPMFQAYGGDGFLDYASHGFVFLFADWKFITIFSTLFGAGLGLMSEKALARGAPFGWRYTRRLGILFLFGAAHVTLLWFGDILLFYSLVGFVAMWFRKCRVKTLLWWAFGLFLFSGILVSLLGLVDPDQMIQPLEGPDGEKLSPQESLAQMTEDVRETFSSGSFGEMALSRLQFFGGMLIFMVFLFGPRTLALFLIGIAVIKSGVLHRIDERRSTIRKLAITSLGIAVPLEIAALAGTLSYADTTDRVAMSAGLYFGSVFLSFAYVCLFALWSRSQSLWLGLRTRIAAVGRMALTNYISHSLITSIIFNFCGQYDRWRRPYLLVLVFAIFAFQLWISPIWLRHFRFGPLEWIWRMATYGKWLPLRHA